MSEEKLKLLIVDDEASIRNLLSLIIGEDGSYSISMAEDAASALEKIAVDAPDILLTDVHMPGMSGLDLMATVRTWYPSVRVIAMSGTHSGDGIPDGVPADAFYLKDGRNWLELLRIMERVRAISPANLSKAL